MPNSSNKRKILVAPLNWGLGHATRCIPIINVLIHEGFEPVLAGDGDSLKLLKKEFHDLMSYELPSYAIQYTKNGKNLKYKLLFDALRINKIIKKEYQTVNEIIRKENIKGIISDNRFGVRSNQVPSVYITHQVNVLSGATSFITSKYHQYIISKFDICWVPDYKGKNNLAGKLSHTNTSELNLKYINPLSRFDEVFFCKEKPLVTKKYDILAIISGPEPQRSLFEEKLLDAFKTTSKKVLFVRGIVSDKEKEKPKLNHKNVKIVNYMLQEELQKSIIESELIIARSGYSTIMDLEKLCAKAFFIPTPGQYEQEYLAKYLQEKNIAPWSSQNNFKMNDLKKHLDYTGFKQIKRLKKDQVSLDIFRNQV
ncbi:MAG: glycosyltransferase [Flavobacteriaceae bacterium]|nr:glycosyltransferase [Flavobacteriaceae bacterium]